MENLKLIENNDVYKKILSDSFGGVMYNVANRDKYEKTWLLTLWNNCNENEKSMANGIMKWAINFIQGN